MTTVRFRPLRLWWMRQHARGRCWMWCQDCRWGQDALATGEYYYHDEPRWFLDECWANSEPVEIIAPPTGPNITIGPPDWKPLPTSLTNATGQAGPTVICWRQGGKVPHHVYAQRGEEPDRRPYPDGDPPIAMFLDPADAELACRAIGLLSEHDNLYVPVALLQEQLCEALEWWAYEGTSGQRVVMGYETRRLAASLAAIITNSCVDLECARGNHTYEMPFCAVARKNGLGRLVDANLDGD